MNLLKRSSQVKYRDWLSYIRVMEHSTCTSTEEDCKALTKTCDYIYKETEKVEIWLLEKWANSWTPSVIICIEYALHESQWVSVIEVHTRLTCPSTISYTLDTTRTQQNLLWLSDMIANMMTE